MNEIEHNEKQEDTIETPLQEEPSNEETVDLEVAEAETEETLTDEELLKLEEERIQKEQEEKKKRVRKEIMEWIKTIVFAIALYLLIDFFIARVVVDGSSMNPGIEHGDLLLVNKVVYQLSDIEYGDVVVFPYPNNPEKDYIKRVIAKEGDTVETIDGLVYVNGEQIDESYLDPDAKQVIPHTVVPEDSLYVLGDNRNNSSDSRRWGMVAEEDIIGKAFFTYWPPNHVGIIE